jgi:putative PIN family toxin of toxin-antitoxin system
MIVPDGPPGRVLDAARRGSLDVVASWELAAEIADVLHRPRLRRYGISAEDVEDILGLLAPLLPSVDVEVEIRDPSDAPVVAAALAGGAEAIVTGDRDLLEDERLRSWLRDRSVDVLTPLELLDRLAPREP